MLASFTCVAFSPLDAFKCIYMYLKHLINMPVFILSSQVLLKCEFGSLFCTEWRIVQTCFCSGTVFFRVTALRVRFLSLWIILIFCHLESKAISSLSAAYNKWLITAIKNQATGHYILNGKGEEVKSRSFIDLGVEWHYIIEGDVETLQTDGPLHDPVVVLVITLPYLSHSYMNSSRRLFTW